MKPPTRLRSRPTRFDSKSGVQTTAWNRNLLKGWMRKDKLKILEVLKQQQESSSPLDWSELQKTLPERSLQQIEDAEKTLKSSLVHKVFLHVRNQRKEQRESRVPIEIWGDMLQKTSQSYERTVSAAFSEMFLLAAMEPSSLIHSHPPSSIASSLQPSPLSSTHVSPSQPPKSPRRRSATLKNTATSPRSDTSCSDKAPTTPKLSSSPETTIPSPPSTLQRPRPIQWVVNFDNIYRYLSTGVFKSCKSFLSPSESAVILDLLMSLPEELPLLKSKELQHHFLQAYDYLSKPAVTPASTTAKVSHASATATKKPAVTKRSSAKPANQSSVRKPASQSTATEPTNQSAVSQPTNQSTATEPTNQSAVSQPTNQSAVSQPTNQSAVSQPTIHSSVREPTSQSTATEPINQSPELPSQLSVTQPSSQSSATEPINQSSATEPTNQSLEPTNQSLEPTNQSPATEASADICPLNPLLVPVALLQRQSHG